MNHASRSTLLKLGAALLLSYAVLISGLIVTVHNLGARDDISYINGGKVFRQQGTMWYHLPGLQEIGLAPQNIGAQINLRNNEFAMLDRDFSAVSRIDVDFALAEGALLMVILDRHREGTFRAVRLTSFPDEKSPFVNAVITFEKGRVVNRVPLPDLGRTLTPGDHSVTVELSDGTLTTTVDGASASIDFPTHEIRPRLALGCGERNTTIRRWSVVGADDDGRPLEWAEEFSIMRSIDRHASNLLLLALQLWGLLLGLPLLKVALEARADPIELIVEALLMPTPRWIFGLVCALPVFPLAVQWILGGLYVTYAWLTLWEHLAKSRRTWALEPGTGRGWAILGPALVLVAAGLLFARHSIRDSVIDLEEPPSSRAEHVSVDGAAPLLLGEGLEAAMEERSFAAATATVSLTLAEGEVARVDALTSAPPVTTDVYQVDRSQDGPEIGSGTDPGPDEGGGGADYKLLALSAIASTDPGMPGQLRLLVADKLERSPHVGWRLEPGRHTLSITVAAPLAWVTVNGRIMDLRTDVPIGTQIGAARVMSMTPGVSQVHRLAIWSPDTTLLSTVQSRSTTADLVGAFALIVLILGIGASILALVPLSLDRTTVVVGLLKALRAHTLLLVWLGFWLAGRLTGFSWGDDPWQQTYGAIAVLFSVVNLAQVLRQSRPDRTRTQRAVGWVALAVVFTVGIEGVSHLSPEWRHNWTTYWSHGLSPKWYYVQDPMIRRLNPWFIDQRFKRRDWAPTHPDKTRIVVFGGSQTYGWGIPAMDRMAFSDQLERALVSGGHTDVEVLNASFPGVKTATGLRWFASNLLRYEPDIVVINFVVNEFMNVDQYHVWSGDVGPDDRISWLSLGAFAEKWRGRIMGNHLSQIIVANVYEVYAMEQCLRWWVDIAEKQGVKVVFSIEPTNLYVESGGDAIMQGETALGDAQGVYRTLGKELGIPVYDALPHFAKEQENMWFYDTMHMSRLGHRVFAENLAGLIETEYLVKTP